VNKPGANQPGTGENKPEGERAKGQISRGANEPGGEPAKGQKSHKSIHLYKYVNNKYDTNFVGKNLH